jgi:SAM-dependent methyltransferase
MDTSSMKPGDRHYRAYVGPPAQYDFMGLTQLALLYAAGLREHHKLLDLGCGSLRAGKLLIPFLAERHYCGIEPNRWLVEEGIAQNLGADLVQRKAPRFDFNADFDCSVFGEHFDYAVAQSILSHTKVGMAARCVANMAKALAPDGLLLATFVLPDGREREIDPPGDEWVYPGIVHISAPTIAAIFTDAGLHFWALPWFHPRQTWFAASPDPARLGAEDAAALSGFVVGQEKLRRR